MTSRDRTVIAVVCALALIAGTWLLLIQPKRNQASKLGSQISSEQSQLVAAQAQVAAGLAAKGSFAGSYTLLARLGEAVPTDDNVPSLIYQLQAAASAAKVDFRSLNLVPGSGGGAPAPAAAAGAASATQAASAALPPGATVGPAGFPVEPFTFNFRGSFFRLADFLGRLEQFVVANNSHVAVSGRLMTLNAISLGPAPQGFPQITASISATTYLLPASQGLMGGATPAGPATSTTSVSTSANTSSAIPAAVVTPPVK